MSYHHWPLRIQLRNLHTLVGLEKTCLMNSGFKTGGSLALGSGVARKTASLLQNWASTGKIQQNVAYRQTSFTC